MISEIKNYKTMNKYSNVSDDEALDWIFDLRDFLPDEIKKVLDDYTAIVRKLYIAHLNAGDTVYSILNKITAKQYPEIEKPDFEDLVFRGTQYEFFFMDRFPLVIQKMINDRGAGKNIRQIYPYFIAMTAETAVVDKPALLTAEDHKKYPKLSAAQWQKKMSKHNAEVMLYFNYAQKRKKEFMDYVKKSLLKYFPGIKKFGDDDILVYTDLLNDMYLIYKNACDIEVRIIDYGLQNESYRVGKFEVDLAQKIKQLPKEKQAEGLARQKLRLMGQKVNPV
jgi:hypothetical protein